MNKYSYKPVGETFETNEQKRLTLQKPTNQGSAMKFQGRTATAIIICPENKILLIKRSSPPFIDYWALPGGRSELGEAVERTVVREVKEETGLDVRVIRKVGEYHEQGTERGQEYDYYAACFLAEPIGGEIRRQESEIAEVKLFSLDALPAIMAFVHAQMIKDYFAQERNKKTCAS